MNQALQLKLKNAPKKPGVYIFKNGKLEVIYIGKAKNIFKRVNSYFQKEHQDPKTALLVPKIVAVDFLVTDNELEALILEINLIKKHRPAYNIGFKDDKSYPYIAVTLDDKFPRISITREAHKKGVKYFGPYVNVGALRETVNTLRSIFPLRTCRNSYAGRSSHKRIVKGKATYTPCLNYHIERCLSPCSGKVDADQYRKIVNKVVDFLDGKSKATIESLENAMREASDSKQFEKAARIRDRLVAAQKISDKQKMESENSEDVDVFGSASKDGYFAVALFMVRDGKLLGSESFQLKENAETEPLLSFIKHYYHTTSYVPKEVLISQEISDVVTLATWLKNLRGANVKLSKPQKGRKKRLVDLASKNAGHNLDFYLKRLQVESERLMKGLKQLKDNIGTKMPYRMECFDISNIAGTSAVGSMVVFENGKAKKDHYRKFKVRFDEGINDYQMLAEVIGRRFKGLSRDEGDASFKTKPDLIIVDGGKGQLSAAEKVFEHYFGDSSSSDIPDLVALAKREEELFVPGRAKPIELAKDSAALLLVMAIRDEAHRFAIQYHRQLRSKKMLASTK